MIRINLITTKRGKSIPIGNIIPALFVILALLAMGGLWLFGVEQLKTWNEDKKAEEARLNDEIRRQSSKVKTKDDARRRVNSLKRDIENLTRLSGANLVQWSTTLDSLTSIVPEKTVWITSMRIDSDRRVQITAYSCNEEGKEEPKEGAKLTRGIQDFIEALQRHSYFQEIFLSNATKNVYEKKPVWRFEINCRLTRDLATGSED